jgi:O-antigen ligase
MLICVIEFVVDVYQNPPNWINCLFYLRQILLLLFALVLLVLFIDPKLVMMIVREGGIRLLGGHVATMTVVPEFIAIISAYSFLYSLEPRVKSTLFFLIGLTGTLVTQARGAEIGLFISLAILCVVWAKDKKRSVSILISGVIACVLLAWTVAGTVGAENIWDTFNRGQDAEGIATASGRSEVWSFAIQYCIAHPQGMGYVAGFRSIFTKHFSLMLNLDYSHLGNTHNSFLQVLVDAGWVALALYLAMLAKTIALGLRLAKKRVLVELPSNSVARHAIRCGLLLLLYCFLCGMGGSDFCVPLQPCFYYQNIIIAVILGASARLLAASRSRELFIAK